MNHKKQSYRWSGLNANFEKTKGSLIAFSLQEATLALRKQGVIVQKISKCRPFWGLAAKKIPKAELALFVSQLATLLQAGLPLMSALSLITKGQKNQSLQALIAEIAKGLEAGQSLFQTLKQYPEHFNDLFCNLILAGEQSGQLDIMLERLAVYLDAQQSMKKKIKKALRYPLLVLSLGLIVSGLLMILVIPQFEQLFRELGAPLPALTQALIHVSQVSQKYWLLTLISLSGLGLTLQRIYKKVIPCQHALQRLILTLPILGVIISKTIVARFTRTLSLTFAAGIPLREAINIAAHTCGNQVYYQAAMRIEAQVAEGKSIHQAIQNTHVFPQVVTELISIGEESGRLDDMLTKIATLYEAQVNTSLDTLGSLLEPLIMSVLGVFIGGLVLALYYPIFTLGTLL